MLKRIVAITFVALLSLALAGTSIAEAKKVKENQGQAQAAKTFQNALGGPSTPRTYPQQGTGPKGSGTTGRGASGRK
jgi:hypothetical protein